MTVFSKPARVAIRKPEAPAVARPRTVSLTNRAKGTRSFNLTHAELCGEHCVCEDVHQRVVGVAAGSRRPGLKRSILRCPPPLTLLAEETRRGLPAAIVNCPEIAAAIAARRLAKTEE
jgi:hypothetical protein